MPLVSNYQKLSTSHRCLFCQSVQQQSTYTKNKLATTSNRPHSYTPFFDNHHPNKQACSHCQRKIILIFTMFTRILYYAVSEGLLDLFPSMASFFFWQFVQRNGPSHGLDTGEKKDPVFIDKPSPEGWSAWQTAQRNIPEFVLDGKSLPNLHFKKTDFKCHRYMYWEKKQFCLNLKRQHANISLVFTVRITFL